MPSLLMFLEVDEGLTSYVDHQKASGPGADVAMGSYGPEALHAP